MSMHSGSPSVFVVGQYPANKRFVVLGALIFCLMVFGTHGAWAQTLSIEQQVSCQTAIDEIRWSHTLWPETNPGTKPALSDVVSADEIASKVTDTLRMSAALEQLYGTRIDARQLQAELDRMAVATRAPDQLREIYDALGNDALAVAECLARPRLTREYLRRAYAWDRTLHAETREQAQSSLATGDPVPAAEAAEMIELTYVIADEDTAEVDAIESGSDRTAALSQQEWTDRLVALTQGGDDSRSGSVLREKEDAFVVEELLEQHDDRFTIRSHIWRKQPFELWWQGESEKFPAKTIPADKTPLLLTEVAAETADREALNGGGLLDTWRHEYYAPTALAAATAVWTGEEMIVWGGLNRAYRYTPATDSWTMASTVNAPTARARHSAIWTGSEMVVWGGYQDGPVTINTGGRYNPLLDQWTPTSTENVPAVRSGHSAVWTGQEMIVWGGSGFNGNSLLNSGGRYDPLSDSWTPTSQGPGVPTGRNDNVAVWTGDKMIIWGGNNSNTGGVYDPETDSWSATSMVGVPTHRDYPEGVWTGSEMIVWGGYPYMLSGGRYNPSTNTWLPTPNGADMPTARYGHTVVWTGEEMIVWGGQANFQALNTGSRYNPASNVWLPLALDGAPKARRGQVAVWTGSEMIIWGGQTTDDYSALASGGRYDPNINAWQPTSTGVYVPAPRSYHASVWTGTEMIVWGGQADGWEDDTKGGRYDVITATWSPTSMVQAPPALTTVPPTVVWTGLEMIIWGGYGGGMQNKGHRYRPMNDSWSPTAITAQTPSPRYSHTAVWTGTEMIVWGGGGPNNQFWRNDGARYDPVADSWSTISSAADVLAPRGRHTAVWTGVEMIVWGGYSDTFEKFNDGARYDPVDDSWTPTSIESATPSARYLHEALWTGSEMLVWGGIDTTYTNTGARYQPSNDSWTPLPVNGETPSPRSSFTAIWTGDEMIVWGGSSSTSLSTGGRFNIAANTWRATSLENAPQSRSSHSAVWTGTEMLVWGGSRARALNDLSAYLPLPVPDVIFAHDFELPDDEP